MEDVTSTPTRFLQMDRKKAREECVGTFNLISSDSELELNIRSKRALMSNLVLYLSILY